jgi:hypothetical protein
VALLNTYTSVPATRTLAEIQAKLAKAGAAHITVRYDQGRPRAIVFGIETPAGYRDFMLPANVEAVATALKRGTRMEAKYRTPAHAENVAWRILKDWVEAQLAIIEAQMATLDQVMLPYMMASDGQTVYEMYRRRQLELGK